MSRREEGPPSNLRRGYGFQEARAAGAPYVRPRPGWKMNWDVESRKVERKLRRLVKEQPSLECLVREIIEEQKAQGYSCADLFTAN
jgi:hypothetical protein